MPRNKLTLARPSAAKLTKHTEKSDCCILTCVVQAMRDFNNRIKEYEKVYVPLTDGKSNRHIHFIQLVNMVTGRGYMDVNRISGYIPGKIVFFLMQVCLTHAASCPVMLTLWPQ
jgi:6-phosphofructo-2-kinase